MVLALAALWLEGRAASEEVPACAATTGSGSGGRDLLDERGIDGWRGEVLRLESGWMGQKQKMMGAGDIREEVLIVHGHGHGRA